jgi:hypothetical protein
MFQAVAQIIQDVAAPFGAMLVGYAALLYALHEGYAVPEEALLLLWVMAPVLAGVTAWRNKQPPTT